MKLGCVMPGESPAVFGDALRRLAATATFLYQDGARFWYSTQPTVTKLAEDRAEQYTRDPDAVIHEVDKRLRADLNRMGDFKRVHPMPATSADVPDDLDAKLVVLGIDSAYSKEAGNAAEAAAKAIHESRGTTPRLYRNTIVFLAADKTRLQDLDEAVRKLLAWESILKEKATLNLSPHQVAQAETQRTAADSTVAARLPETYQWLLLPTQKSPHEVVEWQAIRLSGHGGLAERVSKKLANDELMLTKFAASLLRLYLDRIPLWRGDHVAIRQLIEDFGRYVYLPRLQGSAVLLNTASAGPALLTWEKDTFAYAEAYDEAERRYRGLRFNQNVAIAENDAGVLVRPEAARRQIDAEVPPSVSPEPTDGRTPKLGDRRPVSPGDAKPSQLPRLKRYHGTVTLDSTRVGRDASEVADEVVTHLVGLVGSSVRITLEIEAEIPAGVPESVVRTVTENTRTLKFTSNSGFETE